jgi:hypothetical protein
MSFDNTQLTSANGYDVKNMRFRKPIDGSIPNSTVVFKRVPIGTRNPDGSYGDLCIQTPKRLFSFGLSPNTNMNTGKTDGYTLSLCLYNKDAPTDEEKAWVDTFNRIVDNIKDYILSHRDEIEKYELEAGDLKKLNPLYYKKEKGKIVDGSGPVLYPKVLQNKKTDTITTPFCDENGKDIDPMNLLNKRCWANAVIKIESIFIGAKISLQIKVYEAQVKMLDSAPKRLLQKMVETNDNVVYDAPVESKSSSANDEEDDESIKGSDDDDEEKETVAAFAAPVPVAKAPVRRAGARKA